MRVSLLALWAFLLAGYPPGGCALSADEKPARREQPPATIVSPKDSSEVEESEDLEGRLSVKEGYPVVMVRPMVPQQPWYVQGFVESVKDGGFSTPITVGDKKTRPGTTFRLAIVVAKSRAEAAKFKEGMTMPRLPAGLPRSNFVEVKRK
jgi:hypothetical protein